ncbi:glycosyltransferase family 39 protein [Sulfobacillus thermosulfidooxidans]|uniref:glycosyltransferase family 39 protein n=1 Tax=Sulfobacillus thermosulfidooxidans TaxID=28034 RepID=UPI00096B9E66|nr:hypothetical protein [Sulfobacillus thermosulfidooxidans]OLZ09519.1 hypothetical protein BFX05_11140 [Sulfobacillus thermosulfidooxidans]OLZ16175.1 hypothetical protein BFX06_03900 [Sulfobacillus thermosulfidooxidans]OLZ17977.1 hypothetical protein BFX07_06230 [Sulfobacillus thermosulfidooxidans]
MKRLFRNNAHSIMENIMLILAIIAVSSMVIFHHLGQGSIWRDEAFSVELSKESLGVISHVLFTIEGNMYLYYVILHFWLNVLTLFHISWLAFPVRIPNAVGYVLASVALYALLRTMYHTKWLAVMGVVFFLGFPYIVTYSQQARSFSLFLLFTVLSYLSLWQFLNAPRRRSVWWTSYVLTSTLDLYSFLNSLFYVAAQFILVWTLWRKGDTDRTHFLQFLWALALGAGLGLPLLPPILAGGQVGWVPLPTLSEAIHLIPTYLEQSLTSPLMILIVLLGSFAIVAWIRLPSTVPSWLQITHRDEMALWFGLTWMILPPAESYVSSYIRNYHVFDPVYLLPTVEGLIILLVGGLKAIRSLQTQLTLIALSVFLVVPQWIKGQGISLENWRQPMLTWAHDYRAGQEIVCMDNIGGCQYTIQYYIDAYHLPIKMGNYPGHFTWNEYINLPAKGAYFAEAVNVNKLRQAGYLKPGRSIWFIFNSVPPNATVSLDHWLHQHAVMIKQLTGHNWPVSFVLYHIK